MADFERKYSDEQTQAIQQAWGDRGLRPAKLIRTLAEEGELTSFGELVPAFKVPDTTIRDIGGRYVRRREKAAKQALAQQAPRDTVDALRRRIANVLDAQLDYLESQQARGKFDKVRIADVQQIGKALRELAAMPGPGGEPAQGRKPGARDSEGRQDGRTRTGLAGQLLGTTKARKPAMAPAQSDPSHQQTSERETMVEVVHKRETSSTGGHGRISAGETGAEAENSGGLGEPGAYARAQVAALAPSP